jgi:hypothetical protein
MKVDEDFAKEQIERWISAWNHHCVKEIVSLYSENILFHSPKLAHIYPKQVLKLIPTTQKMIVKGLFNS